MELYIIRHAIAQPLGNKNDFTDEARALTSEGRDKMRDVARGMRKLGLELDLILTSPLVRAVETAEILASVFGESKKDIEQTGNLAPGASSGELFAELKGWTGVESVALVGHQPDLGELICKVVGSDGGFFLELKKGGVCCITVTETVPDIHGALSWLMTPKQMRLLSKL
ncbi:MAG TPA: phosphohistidine phosphatase SixA [Blastocatellia bacterium]|jgi:phosphohistidine phosphatase|nr:phosphohistidine phosphatase SixA [Blastocatellia bacterium]